jgi:hypothetical protein
MVRRGPHDRSFMRLTVCHRDPGTQARDTFAGAGTY